MNIMNCIVCGKGIYIAGANTCSTRCLLKGARKQIKTGGRERLSPGEVVNKLREMAMKEPSDTLKVPTVRLAHPWIRNKNYVQNGIVVSFDGNGVAEVPEMAKDVIQIFLRKQRGFFLPDEVKESPADGVVKTPIEMKADGKPAEATLTGAPKPSKPQIEVIELPEAYEEPPEVPEEEVNQDTSPEEPEAPEGNEEPLDEAPEADADSGKKKSPVKKKVGGKKKPASSKKKPVQKKNDE